MKPASSFLEQVRASLPQRLAALKLPELEHRARDLAPLAVPYPLLKPSFVIAEIKFTSPSLGVLQSEKDPAAWALRYHQAGAAMISVLTEPLFFHGQDAYLSHIRQLLPQALLLRKDFIAEPVQIAQARVLGANVVLLMASFLSDSQLSELFDYSHQLGLGVLLEVHDAAELERVQGLKPPLLGINNRNLHSLAIDLSTSKTLIAHKTPGSLWVSESGLDQAEQLVELAALGFDGFLIGSALMRAPDLAAQLAQWCQRLAT